MNHPNDRFRPRAAEHISSHELGDNDARLFRVPAHLLLNATYGRPNIVPEQPTLQPKTPSTPRSVDRHEITSDDRNDVQIIDIRAIREKYKSSTLLSGATEKSHNRGPGQPSEDALLVDPRRALLGVFDGVGNAVLADEAARAASETVANALSVENQIESKEMMAQHLRRTLLDAHHRILGIDTPIPAGREHPATTATIAKIFRTPEGEQYAAIASIGDSRAYLSRQQPEGAVLVSLTTDQVPTNLSQRELKARQDRLSAVETPDDLLKLSDLDQAAWGSRNMIGGALGSRMAVEPQIILQRVYPGDKIIVTTDGIHDNLSTRQIQEVLRQHDTSSLAQALVAQAQRQSRNPLNARKKPDDMTAGALEVLA